jgi:hypothetical protein
MKTSNTAVWVVGAVIVIALLGWAITRVTNTETLPAEDNSTTTPVGGATGTVPTNNTPPRGGTVTPNSGLGETYANATHGFTISYPRELNAESFGIFHALNQNDWRYGATLAKRGTPVISIPVIQIDNTGSTKKNYPLFYTAQVRVGVSTDTAQCYAKDDGYTEQTVTDVTINGVAFKKFIFGDAATQQYVNGASYRTIHDNKCYVIEQIQNGSSYRDETLVGGYSDADLRNFYAQTTPIVMSFKFSK